MPCGVRGAREGDFNGLDQFVRICVFRQLRARKNRHLNHAEIVTIKKPMIRMLLLCRQSYEEARSKALRFTAVVGSPQNSPFSSTTLRIFSIAISSKLILVVIAAPPL
jgi:hypothetical protein